MATRPLRKHIGSCHCEGMRLEIEADHFEINLRCLHGFDLEGTPVRQAVGADMP